MEIREERKAWEGENTLVAWGLFSYLHDERFLVSRGCKRKGWGLRKRRRTASKEAREGEGRRAIEERGSRSGTDVWVRRREGVLKKKEWS